MDRDYVKSIADSGLTIYDHIEIGDPELWVPTPELEAILDERLRGISLAGLALRTRSKVVKESVCRALGYPVPSSFKKTQPRFVGQMFDTYAQKSNNLQVWNEELSPTRRYVILRVDEVDQIARVKVVNGEELAQLDTTGTLTQKYQARLVPGVALEELVSPTDTDALLPHTRAGANLAQTVSPIDHPAHGMVLPIGEVFERLRGAVGRSFPDAGWDQERNRGAALHRIVCELLGYADYRDDGRFPDVRNQLLEVKLQTSPTIDLGLVRPSSEEPLDVPQIAGTQVRHCDVRYALFYAQTDGTEVTLTRLYLTTGASFFSRFPQFGGKVLNKKLQIPLPSDFFYR
ncbi:restriction endonuclease [Celeribacter baekdonensis]|uniref:Restriction endonuclease n=1 Tax=Celeribacter baekdonensis TaxID=875171 RepID=A0A2R4M7B2_9RHOB|nr:restriction endonuclease [Celeribacter baekdonensis]AVW93036.1 restriction endonuclease [Celeribacter baekdonensis]